MMNSTPLVSIIIPTYNRAHLIGETLDSVLVQTYTNWECIIVDDGSTDDTVEVVDKYVQKDARFQYHKRPKDRLPGGNAARNYGFEVSRGEYVNWFDSDDFMLPDFLKLKVGALSLRTDLVLSLYRYANFDLTRFRDSKLKLFVPEKHSLFKKYVTDFLEIQLNACLWSREFLTDKKLFDETYRRFQDNEFQSRMFFYKPELAFVSKVLATIRGGNGQANQISSKVSQTHKKIEDIYKYRFNNLKLGYEFDQNDEEFIRVLYKKNIWSFYEALKSLKGVKSKITFLKYNKDKINVAMEIANASFFSKLKFSVYCFKIFFIKHEL